MCLAAGKRDTSPGQPQPRYTSTQSSRPRGLSRLQLLLTARLSQHRKLTGVSSELFLSITEHNSDAPAPAQTLRRT